jgi:hypothetical protein
MVLAHSMLTKAFTAVLVTVVVLLAVVTAAYSAPSPTPTPLTKELDTIKEFLLTSAAKDFQAHQPPRPSRFRNVRIGHVTAGKESSYRLCGEFLPAEGGDKAEWTPFVTIKTSGYEQYIGSTSYCSDPKMVWDIPDDLSSSLMSKMPPPLEKTGGPLQPPPSENSAPVVWSEYQIREQKLSIPFPKLPVVRRRSDLCSQTEGATYHAYARGVVYVFEWHAKSNKSIPDWCRTNTKFSIEAFTGRIDDLKANRTYEESEGTVAGLKARVLRMNFVYVNAPVVETRWLVWQEDRWLEMGITHRKETVVDEARFLSGLKLSSSSGSEIGKGADSTLGDAVVDPQPEIKVGPLVVLAKPPPGYTDAAREHNVQGTVVLRATFLGNGGIGAISVIKELPYGLTEQSVNAARRIAFLPKTVGGIPVNVEKQIEYMFSIY